ncbi:hypothetical protein Q5P01_008379 [Channa striata]|uniref:snRNA-activating protein complex subunit 2 n=1 Tax=Channa striata TaxID=64152 RepID=A0AA88T2Z2_CHASR|nr:hypothetical protein Q5P01_008379 [Channa striata]
MKPPPRARTKPNHNLDAELVSHRKFRRTEQRKLINALKRLSRTAGGNGDIDYAYLRKYVPSRSISEIQSVVEYAKNKAISCACSELRKKKSEEKFRKPIEVWAHLASVVAGTLEEPISTAFSQMLRVSSTEPCTLKNCDPPQVNRPPTDRNTRAGRTIPFGPVPHLPIQGEHPSNNTESPLLGLKTAALMMDQAKKTSAASQVVLVPKSIIQPEQKPPTTAGLTPAATSTSQFAVTSCQLGKAEKHILLSTCPESASQSVKLVTGQVTPSSMHAAMVKTQRDGSSVIQTTQHPTEQHITSVSTFSSTTSTSFGHINKNITEESPRTLGVECVVDFERIYHYLSVIQKPEEDCHLTQMESAIVLDLLMSLPEEFSMLNCNRLHKHLVQVYQYLSSPADSKMERDMFKNLKDGVATQTETQSGGDCSGAMDSGTMQQQPDEADGQFSGNSNMLSQLRNADVLAPPLNPFMMPLKLLMRR